MALLWLSKITTSSSSYFISDVTPDGNDDIDRSSDNDSDGNESSGADDSSSGADDSSSGDDGTW